MMRADLLTAPVEGLDDALAAADALDRALVAGLLRPQADQAADLALFAQALVGSPLASRVAEAAEKASAGAAGEDHFVALAAARTALLGAAADALSARAAEATGRTHGPAADAAEADGSGDVDGGPGGGGPAPAGTTRGPTGSGSTGSGAVGGAGASASAGDADSAGASGGGMPANLGAAARSWLCDLARAGWRGLDHELVAGAAPVVSAMLPDPALRRAAALLDGFAAELAASCPGATLERIPARRWGDLWARAMVLTLPGAMGAPAPGAATGRLLPLGVDLHEHATAAQAQVHAVFEPADGGPARLVRASVSAPKPDTVVGAGVWQLLRPHMSLLAAAAEGRSMDLADMPLTAEGDLLWDDARARDGGPADAFATARVALPAARAAATAPLDRHPARLAVPVFLEGYAARRDEAGALEFVFAGRAAGATGAIAAGSAGAVPGAGDDAGAAPAAPAASAQEAGTALAVDATRVPAAGPLTPEAVAASTACIALLRWDAGAFRVQPLAVRTAVRKKAVAVHAGAWAAGTTDKLGAKAEKAATDAVAVLRERSGKLLRK